MGWGFKWFSSADTDFNFDYGVSCAPDDLASPVDLVPKGGTRTAAASTGCAATTNMAADYRVTRTPSPSSSIRRSASASTSAPKRSAVAPSHSQISITTTAAREPHVLLYELNLAA